MLIGQSGTRELLHSQRWRQNFRSRYKTWKLSQISLLLVYYIYKLRMKKVFHILFSLSINISVSKFSCISHPSSRLSASSFQGLLVNLSIRKWAISSFFSLPFLYHNEWKFLKNERTITFLHPYDHIFAIVQSLRGLNRHTINNNNN